MIQAFLIITLFNLMKPDAHEQYNEDIIARLEQLIAAILDTKTKTPISLDVALWNTSDVAEYLKISYRYASEYIVTHHTFPNALRLPNKKEKKGHPRWYAIEVIKWVAGYKER